MSGYPIPEQAKDLEANRYHETLLNHPIASRRWKSLSTPSTLAPPVERLPSRGPTSESGSARSGDARRSTLVELTFWELLRLPPLGRE